MDDDIKQPPLFIRLLLILLLGGLTVSLSVAILSLPEQAPGLSTDVAENLNKSGVSNPVTAVLLNYRAYDTLLELGVLFLALLGIWSLGESAKPINAKPGPVLDILSRVLTPLLILVAGYLLWVGAYQPGGAFQAGAVLGAAGVLLLLSGWQLNAKYAGFAFRVSVVAGLLIFVIIGLTFILFSNQFLQYPPYYAPGLILFIETAATVSIGISLVALFLGGEPKSGLQK